MPWSLALALAQQQLQSSPQARGPDPGFCPKMENSTVPFLHAQALLTLSSCFARHLPKGSPSAVTAIFHHHSLISRPHLRCRSFQRRLPLSTSLVFRFTFWSSPLPLRSLLTAGDIKASCTHLKTPPQRTPCRTIGSCKKRPGIPLVQLVFSHRIRPLPCAPAGVLSPRPIVNGLVGLSTLVEGGISTTDLAILRLGEYTAAATTGQWPNPQIPRW